VRSILNDELRHMQEMTAALERHLPRSWRALVHEAMRIEERSFRPWIAASHRELPY
jgi:hypothetical protein